MVSPGWARLRPVNADLRRVVTVLTLVVALALAAAGAWSIVDHFRTPQADRRTAVSITIYVYTVVFGVLLALGELALPPGIYAFFGFLASSAGRAFFLIFFASLAASAGWSADRGKPSAILMIIAGFTGIVVAILALCYGRDHGEPAPLAAPEYGGAAAGRGQQQNTPDSVI